MKLNFLDVCSDVTKTATKIPQGEYLINGLYPIYDQGKDYVGGYSNDNSSLAIDFPYIIFGDHTRVIKFVNNACYIGADGVKLLKVTNSDFMPKYVYYSMLASPVTSQGYARHFKLLKETKIKQADIETQKFIIQQLDLINNAISVKENELESLDELIKSRFIEMFGYIDEENKFVRKQWNEVVSITNGKDHKQVSGNGIYGVYGTGGRMMNSTQYLCDEGTIIMGRKGTIDKPYICNEKCWIVDTAFGVNSISPELNQIYLYYYTKQIDYSKLNKACTLPSTTKSDLLKLWINLPPIELQNEFATFVEQIDKSKFIVQSQIKDLQELLDKKMDEYFRTEE